MAFLWPFLLTILSLVIDSSAKSNADSYVSPESRAILVFTGADFLKPCPGAPAILERDTIKKNTIATRMQVWKNNVVAVFPRLKQGVPVSVAKTPILKNKCNPMWTPVPCWELHSEGICDFIQSAVDIVVDANNHAWILDSGYTGGINGTKQLCPPKVVVVDLDTNTISRHIDLSALTCPASRLQYLAVEQTASVRTFVYVSDASNRAILVWDILEARGFRVVLPKEVLSGCQKDVRDVLYLVLVRHPDGYGSLVFTYLSSCLMFTIRTEFLRSASSTGRVVAKGRKPHQMVLLGSDAGAGLFFRYHGRPEVYKWDTTTKFVSENFRKVYNGQKFRLATSVSPDFQKKRMVVLESNFPDFVDGCVGCGVSHTISVLSLPNCDPALNIKSKITSALNTKSKFTSALNKNSKFSLAGTKNGLPAKTKIFDQPMF